MEGTVKVLIIEDDPTSCSFMKGVLEHAGCDVLTASDGYDGLARVVQERLQCLILSFALPGISGCDVCRRLRASGNTLPIIITSAENTAAERYWSLLQGADRFLPLPCTEETLVENVRDVLPESLRRYVSYTSKHLAFNQLRLLDQKQVDHLVTVIQKLQYERKNGVLTIRRGELTNAEEGWIRFVHGQITEARVGWRQGKEARNWMSTWGTCSFDFVSEEVDT